MMDSRDKQEIVEAVKEAVELHVNGKIRALDTKISPVVDAFNMWSGWRRGMAALLFPLLTLISTGASIAVIASFFTKGKL